MQESIALNRHGIFYSHLIVRQS